MAAYYNEIDPYAAHWLRNLIAAGHIADGVVDSRSIIDVKPDDLKEFTQCHFFAGIGVWSRALRMAQWPDTRRVWTGSCPCQPFSVAGAGGGVHDERHLWPHWLWLIEQCQPEVVLGEQVEAAIRHGWLDLVQSDMEGIGYAFAAAGVPAAGVGAPHIRQRLWFVAHASRSGLSQLGRERHQPEGSAPADLAGGLDNNIGDGRGARRHDDAQYVRHQLDAAIDLGELAHDHQDGCESRGAVRPVCQEHDAEHGGAVGGLADTVGGRDIAGIARADQRGLSQGDGSHPGRAAAGPTNGHWRDADWLLCRDGKWRPVEPGTFPLAHGAPARVGRLRAYGNAIVAQVAQTFIESVMEALP